jgi:hypothetical protein
VARGQRSWHLPPYDDKAARREPPVAVAAMGRTISHHAEGARINRRDEGNGNESDYARSSRLRARSASQLWSAATHERTFGLVERGSVRRWRLIRVRRRQSPRAMIKDTLPPAIRRGRRHSSLRVKTTVRHRIELSSVGMPGEASTKRSRIVLQKWKLRRSKQSSPIFPRKCDMGLRLQGRVRNFTDGGEPLLCFPRSENLILHITTG